jgi:hypothetical protein
MTDRPQRPGDDDPDKWKDYWTAEGMSWRTEQEIDADRQRYLAERRAVTPDIEKGIYPFRDGTGSIPLTRADVEWLLATHESHDVRGPVVWEDERDKPEDEQRVVWTFAAQTCEGQTCTVCRWRALSGVWMLLGSTSPRKTGRRRLSI